MQYRRQGQVSEVVVSLFGLCCGIVSQAFGNTNGNYGHLGLNFVCVDQSHQAAGILVWPSLCRVKGRYGCKSVVLRHNCMACHSVPDTATWLLCLKSTGLGTWVCPGGYELGCKGQQYGVKCKCIRQHKLGEGK